MTRPAIPARTLLVLYCALMLALATAAHAQLAPARSIKLVVPFGTCPRASSRRWCNPASGRPW
jgi:hypothetical protein